jgi:hypothetical protein
MISKKELGYISGWANKVPYPGDDYAEEAMEKLKQAERLFKEIYANNKYNITLSNNEEIELAIKDKNLAHMLGVDFKNLSKDSEFHRNVLENIGDALDPHEKAENRYRESICELSNEVQRMLEENESPLKIRRGLPLYKRISNRQAFERCIMDR